MDGWLSSDMYINELKQEIIPSLAREDSIYIYEMRKTNLYIEYNTVHVHMLLYIGKVTMTLDFRFLIVYAVFFWACEY